RIEVRPGHAGDDGLGTRRDNGRVGLRIEVVEQGRAAEDGASDFTELIAGQSGAIQFVIGRTKVHPIDLDRGRTGGEQQQQPRRGAQLRAPPFGLMRLNRPAPTVRHISLYHPITPFYSLQMGSVAKTMVDNVKSAAARRNTLVRSRCDSNVLTMPPKKSTAANRTVRRTYSSDERLACWA